MKYIKLPAKRLFIISILFNSMFCLGQEFPRMTAITPKSQGEPCLSPNARYAVFSTGSGFARNLHIWDVEQKTERALTDNAYEDSHPRWSPDGNWVVFQREDTLGNRDIWMINVNNSEERNLTHTTEFREQHPRFSNDGKMVIFDGNRDEESLESEDQNYDIYSLNLESQEVQRLTDWDHWDMYASFSPDNNKVAWRRAIAVEGADRPNFEVMVKDLATGEERNISNHEAYDSNPHWSPNADWIVFSSNRDGASNLYVCRSDGSGLRKITQAQGRSIAFGLPTFSFDGKKVVANRYTSGVTDIVMIDLFD